MDNWTYEHAPKKFKFQRLIVILFSFYLLKFCGDYVLLLCFPPLDLPLLITVVCAPRPITTGCEEPRSRVCDKGTGRVEGRTGLPVDECVFVLEKLRWCLYCCMGPCLSIAKVCLVRSKEVLFPLAAEPFSVSVCVCVRAQDFAAALFCMNRGGPLSKLTCYFNLCWPTPVIWQRSLAKMLGQTVTKFCGKYKLGPPSVSDVRDNSMSKIA